MPPKKAHKTSNANHNFYQIIPKSLNKEYWNPNYQQHLLKIPFRMLIVGGSGSGKTNTLMELIHRMSGTFEKIVVCVKAKDEPLYNFLEMKAKDGVEFYEGVESIPDIADFKNCGQTLIVFDDLVLDKQDRILPYFIKGRKMGDGISCCYLSQSYYKTPKVIRINCNYIVLKKLSSTRDLTMVLNENSLGVDKRQLMAIYKYSTADPLDFLMLDLDAPDADRFRRGFLEVIN